MDMSQRSFETAFDTYTTNMGVGSNEYRASILLPSQGHYWRIEEFYVTAHTTYSAQDTSYAAFLLKDSSGNTIASVTNGPASGGLDIDPAGTGVDTSMVTSYRDIDCRTSVDEVYVQASDVGAGRVIVGLRFVVLAVPWRGP